MPSSSLVEVEDEVGVKVEVWVRFRLGVKLRLGLNKSLFPKQGQIILFRLGGVGWGGWLEIWRVRLSQLST